MATISARVPDDIRSQGLSRLRARGATVSDLVNAAFNYLIETGELPGRVSPLGGSKVPGPRQLDAAQREALCQSLNETTFPQAAMVADGNIKRALREGRRRDYEALS